MKYVAKFIPITQGTRVELNDLGIFGVSGKHKVLGFKPGPASEAAGWLVVLVGGTREPVVDRKPENLTALQRVIVAAREAIPFLPSKGGEELGAALEAYENA